MIIIGLSTHAQNFNKEINLNTSFSKTVTINPFNAKEAITGIAVSGNITFYSDTSFVRIIVNDGNGNIYMLYETYPMLAVEKIFKFEYECEETSFLNDYYPMELQIQVKDAHASIEKISLSNEKVNNYDKLRLKHRDDKNKSKIAVINNYIKKNKLLWFAEETELSKKSYSEKVNLFGKNYMTFGYEYFEKGFFSMFGPDRSPTKSHNYVDNFDWRSRHGANNQNSPYYDGDVNGTGWITPVVCQGGGCWHEFENYYECNKDSITCINEGGIFRRGTPTCWLFAAVAQVEAIVNLYYNQHIDIKLSEQYVMCVDSTTSGGWSSYALNHFKNEGVPDDNCITYSASLDNCSNMCTEPEERIWINNYSLIPKSANTNDIKQALITKGPLTGGGLYQT